MQLCVLTTPMIILLQAAGSCGVGTPETLELEDTIGEGGFGVVYKGRVRGPQGEVQVAIKTLKMQVMSPEDKAQFRDESILHIKLRHRNVVRCFAVWDDEPPIKMILEYSEIGMAVVEVVGWRTGSHRLSHQQVACTVCCGTRHGNTC